MKKLMIICMILVLLLTGCSVNASTEISESSDTYEVFFSENDVHEINISILDEDWDDMLENPLEESFHEADITIDGVTLENIAIRTKGNSTLQQVANSDSDRYSLKIKVNKYEDQKLLGLDEFVLNNMFSDASYLREHLSYEAMEAMGAIVPMSSFINVSVNGDVIGLYLLVETVDDSFLNRTFGDNDGNLYRADQGTTLLVTEDQYFENVQQKNGDDESKEDLYAFMDILNEMPLGEKGEIESVLDVSSALNYFAANTVLESYDSLSGQHSQNYYLYNDGGIFSIIPWDYNMAFGSFGGSGQSEVNIDEPVYGVDIKERPLIDKLLAVDEFRKEYYQLLEGYVDYFNDFEEHVTKLSNMIRAFVEDDPSKFTTTENFESNVVYQENGANEATGTGNMERAPINGEMINVGEGQANEDRRPPGDRDKKEGKTGQTMKSKDDQEMLINRQDKMKGGGQMMGGDDTSIINILQARLENIVTQLSNQ